MNYNLIKISSIPLYAEEKIVNCKNRLYLQIKCAYYLNKIL